MDIFAVNYLPLSLYSIVAVLGTIVVLVAIAGLFKAVQQWPFKAVPVMSEVEKRFYLVLKETFPHYHVLAQVQLSRVIRPPRDKREWQWLNKIIRMSVDYVILNEQFETLAVIELDDKSHLQAKRKEADQRKNKALKAAGVRLVRIKTTQLPTKYQLVAMFESVH